MNNIASYLPAMAEKAPYQRAIIVSHGRDDAGRMIYRHMTYAELEEASSQAARGLLALGLKKGERVVLMVPPSFDLFILCFGLFKAGLVPVLVDPGLGLRKLKSCLARAQPKHFIGIGKAHLARVILGWNRGQWSKLIKVGSASRLWTSMEQLMAAGEDQSRPVPASTADDDAAILFTSGSTGSPKGALYSHRNFCAQVEMLRQAFGIKAGEIDLCTFPLFALFAPALGMTAVIPEMDFTRPARVDAEKIFKAIDSFGVENMFGSPALIRRVSGAACSQQRMLPSLKRVISAGAPASLPVIEAMASRLSGNAKVWTPYGATEALPLAIAHSQLLAETKEASLRGGGICVGHPVPGVAMKIIAISDQPIHQWREDLCLATGEVGEICVRGPQVTRSYFNQETATALAKIPVAGGEQFYHRMGDLGYFDAEGRLWFCGRKSHRVALPHKTVFTIPGETIINSHKTVNRSAIVGVGSGSDRRAILCVETKARTPPASRGALRSELGRLCQQHPETQDLEDILFHKEFPVDIRHNSKIFREKLALWAEKELS